MKTVVQIGAGAIGRGFLAPLWCAGGFETVFVDANPALVAEINRSSGYPLRLVSGTESVVQTVAPVRALEAGDAGAVRDALVGCAFAAVSVGARNVAHVAQSLIAPALPFRAAPLNVLLCENGDTVHADFLAGVGTDVAKVGAAKAVVARMVPDGTLGAELVAEPFGELPFDAGAWFGDVPPVPGLLPVPGEAFPAYELRKRFLHNGGHALLAYHGYRHGLTHIYQCAENAEVVGELRGFFAEVTAAFRMSAYRHMPVFEVTALAAYTHDLQIRFANRLLNDGVNRVARDPVRKLARHERLVGAALFCEAHGVVPVFAARAIAAALRYNAPGDPGATELQAFLAAHGVREAVSQFAGVGASSPLTALVHGAFSSGA